MIRYDFAGKVVLVTGGSRGMGAAIVEAFAAAGAECVANYFPDAEGANRRDAEALLAKLAGKKVRLAEGDVSSFEGVRAMMERLKAERGGLDILVNNAGILRDRTLRKMSADEWQAVMRTNLDGVFHCVKHGAEIMRDGGRIVNIASIAGIMGFHGQANYAAAKAGVIALTKVAAKELARRGITVNAVAPGVIRTPMLDALKPEVLAGYEAQIPVGRIGKPEDVANAVLFLASEETGYVTGQTLPITGGWF
ncbi:MAG: 3-oxoacyl-ACP reductase FabG [Gemmataceae bacterium]|nr:3-oxoacyl-ACP reductase FabG [Gemmataceae bacterium]